MPTSTARRMGFPRRRKGYDASKIVGSPTALAFDKEVERERQSPEYKRYQRMQLEADALKKELDAFYDF